MIIHLWQGFWLIQGVPGKQGPTWDKRQNPLTHFDLLRNPTSEN
jgi:hypothetical protein